MKGDLLSSLTANRSEEEPWRLERLKRVAVRAGVFDLAISALHDHKGHLRVSWARMPSMQAVKKIECLWAEMEGESADSVSHYRKGVLICGSGGPLEWKQAHAR